MEFVLRGIGVVEFIEENAICSMKGSDGYGKYVDGVPDDSHGSAVC